MKAYCAVLHASALVTALPGAIASWMGARPQMLLACTGVQVLAILVLAVTLLVSAYLVFWFAVSGEWRRAGWSALALFAPGLAWILLTLTNPRGLEMLMSV